MPLREGLADYALISAFRDIRFRKIDKSELERLQCRCDGCLVIDRRS